MLGGFSHFEQGHQLIFQVTLLGHLMFCNLKNTNLQKMPKEKTTRGICLKLTSCNLHLEAYFNQQKSPSKKNSNDYIIYNLQFMVICIILHNLQNTNLQTLPENSILCNFQIKSCLNQHNKLIDLGWPILFCVICRTQDLACKDTSCQAYH